MEYEWEQGVNLEGTGGNDMEGRTEKATRRRVYWKQTGEKVNLSLGKHERGK